MRRIDLLLFAAVLWAGPVPAHADETTLTNDEITSFVTGKRLAAQRGQADLRLKFNQDGSLSIQDGHAVEKGKWRVEGDLLCMQVSKWSFDGCGKIVRVDGKLKLLEPAGDREHLAFGG
ncbi:MAG: DUF5004 domain-containing protein [Burkholderiales bacterium]|nr:DUF5004 domain-containing protein [Burkholderiales bacterium]